MNGQTVKQVLFFLSAGGWGSVGSCYVYVFEYALLEVVSICSMVYFRNGGSLISLFPKS